MTSASGGVYPRRDKPGGSPNLEVIRGRALSAGSSGLLFKGFDLLTTVVIVDTVLDLLRCQPALGLHDGLLAVRPLRLDRVQPRRLDRQRAGDDPHPALGPRPPVVPLDPRPHPPTDVPGGVAPNQKQRRLALRPQPRTQPRQEILGHLADRPAVYEAQEHPAGVRAQKPVARQRLGVRVRLAGLPLHQAKRLPAGPGVQRRQGQARPPGLVLEAEDPIGVGCGQPDQPVARVFFRA